MNLKKTLILVFIMMIFAMFIVVVSSFSIGYRTGYFSGFNYSTEICLRDLPFDQHLIMISKYNSDLMRVNSTYYMLANKSIDWNATL